MQGISTAGPQLLKQTSWLGGEGHHPTRTQNATNIMRVDGYYKINIKWCLSGYGTTI